MESLFVGNSVILLFWVFITFIIDIEEKFKVVVLMVVVRNIISQIMKDTEQTPIIEILSNKDYLRSWYEVRRWSGEEGIVCLNEAIYHFIIMTKEKWRKSKCLETLFIMTKRK